MSGEKRVFVAEGATTIASLALFDPAALSADFDAKLREGVRVETLAQLEHERGAAFVTDTGADDVYLLHVYLNDRPRPSIEAAMCDLIVVEEFRLPSGTLVFGGTEAMHREDARVIRARPSVATTMHLPSGNYRLKLYRTKFNEDREDELEAMLTDDERRNERISTLSFPTIVVGASLALVGSITRNMASATMGLIIVVVASSLRARAARSVDAIRVSEKRRAIALSRPSIVAILVEPDPRSSCFGACNSKHKTVATRVVVESTAAREIRVV